MSEHSGYQFSTFDRDNDNLNYYCGSSCNCAENNHGGWWYNGCMQSN
uniref:Fibrinogen C-terminal domain-containing protein n=1 Tax=Ciona savignyi TaxID=51511 RepID=H2YNW9_CIOSA